MYELLLAFVLILGSPNDDAPQPTIGLMHSLRSVAVEMELLDEREIRYVFVRPEDFAFDLKFIRARDKELVDAPQLSCANLFPDRQLINEAMAFNRNFFAHVQNNAEMLRGNQERARPWIAAMEQTNRSYKTLDAARDAKCEYYYVSVRRAALKQLREDIGDEAFFSGVLPPAVPLYLFRDIED